jgi:hypothetical protein
MDMLRICCGKQAAGKGRGPLQLDSSEVLQRRYSRIAALLP